MRVSTLTRKRSYGDIDIYSSIFGDIGKQIGEGIVVGVPTKIGEILDSDRIISGLFGYESKIDLLGGTTKPRPRDDLLGGTIDNDKFIRELYEGSLLSLKADVYGKPELAEVVRKVDRKGDERLLEKNAPLNKHTTTYIADVGDVKYIEVPVEGGVKVPAGDREACYVPGLKARVIDESVFPGTRKNRLKIEAYKSGKKAAARLSKYTFLRGFAKRLENFCDYRINELNDKRSPYKTILHEDVHNKYEENGVNAQLRDVEPIEGLTEATTDEILGIGKEAPTTYNVFKKRARETLNYIGANAVDLLKYPKGLGRKFSNAYKSLFPKPALRYA